MRRRGSDIVLESPRAGALFRICDPKIAAALAVLSDAATDQTALPARHAFPGIELLALLVDCQILFKTETANDGGLRSTEGDDNLVLWDFHDLLFHARSTEGRHANPFGGIYPYAGIFLQCRRCGRHGPERKSICAVLGRANPGNLPNRNATA